jgi:hypothetical protein
MPGVSVRRRRDGIVQIIPAARDGDGIERHLPTITALLAATGIFIAGLMPPELLGIAYGCAAAAYVGDALRVRSVLRAARTALTPIGAQRSP